MDGPGAGAPYKEAGCSAGVIDIMGIGIPEISYVSIFYPKYVKG